jgi:hypothetical protein
MSVPDDLFYPCLIFTLEHFTEMEVYVVLYDLLNWPSVYDSELYLNLVSEFVTETAEASCGKMSWLVPKSRCMNQANRGTRTTTTCYLIGDAINFVHQIQRVRPFFLWTDESKLGSCRVCYTTQ